MAIAQLNSIACPYQMHEVRTQWDNHICTSRMLNRDNESTDTLKSHRNDMYRKHKTLRLVVVRVRCIAGCTQPLPNEFTAKLIATGKSIFFVFVRIVLMNQRWALYIKYTSDRSWFFFLMSRRDISQSSNSFDRRFARYKYFFLIQFHRLKQ